MNCVKCWAALSVSSAGQNGNITLTEPIQIPSAIGQIALSKRTMGASRRASTTAECRSPLTALKIMNTYNVYFSSKGTGPTTVQIEALNSAGMKAQVEARYPRCLQHHLDPGPEPT